MHDRIQFHTNPQARYLPAPPDLERHFGGDAIQQVAAFHRSWPEYAPTPMVRLPRLASHLGIRDLWIKDESRRFGLKAFKILGASHALCRALAERLALDLQEPTLGGLTSPDVQQRLTALTCITATDGNHGRALAWAARRLGCRCVVYMPHGTAPARVANVRMFGARVEVIDGIYDEAVRRAADQARRNGWILLQDTAWAGYEQVPRWVMQGYLTLARESWEALENHPPTHVLLQCGVGSFAAAVQAYLTVRLGAERPLTVIVEPTRAACFFESMTAGRRQAASGDLDTLMAGLACGEASTLAWEVLQSQADVFVACPDRIAKRGVRVLGNPLDPDPRIVSGESGAVGLGLVYAAMTDPTAGELKATLGLDETASVLLVSTEGDTDPEIYRQVVWGDG